jgi:hypothetical protein
MRLFSLLLSVSLLSCEVSSVREERPPEPKPELTQKPATVSVVEVLPIKKEAPRGIAAAMRYSLANSTGVFVIDAKRLREGSVVRSFSSDLAKMFALSPEWQQIQNATGLDPTLEVQGIVLSYRQATGAPTEYIVAIVGDFDAAKIAEKTKGGTIINAEARGEVLLIGDKSLLPEVIERAENEPFSASPAISTMISSLDAKRPLYGAFFPPKTSATGAIDKASQVMFESDLDGALHLKMMMLFGSNTEADNARDEIQKGISQITPMLGTFGIPDPSKFTSAFSVTTDANKMTLLISLDEATATTMIKTMVGLSRGVVPPPPPPPPSIPPVRPG